MRHRNRSRAHRFARLIVVVIAVWVFISLLLVIPLRIVNPPVSMVMLLEPGPFSDIRFEWVDRGGIPAHVAQAVIAAEDQRFLDHAGIDFNALDAAIAEYQRGEGLRGASTITQQVAKNLFLWNGRSFVRKVLEACFAVLIDLTWSKNRILEVYLNIAEFGPNVFGVGAAASQHFGQSVTAVSSTQAAALAAVLPAPKRLDAGNPSNYVRTRQREILTQMELLTVRGHYRNLSW